VFASLLFLHLFLLYNLLIEGSTWKSTDHKGIESGNLKLREHAVLDKLLAAHGSENGDAETDGPATKKQKVNGN
jgi:hypothetical protein